MISTATYSKSKSSTGGSGGGSSVVNNYYGSFTPFYLWGNYCDGSSDINGNINAKSSTITGKNIVAKESISAQYSEILSSYTNYLSAVEADLGTLRASGDTHLHYTLVEGNEDVTGDLNVSGTSTFKGDIDARANLDVKGNTTLKDVTTDNINNSGTIKTKNLQVTGSAHFWELIIDKIKAAGGAVLFTPADGFEVDHYEAIQGGCRLYWRSEDEDGKGIMNMWKEGDQAMCRSFNSAQVGTTYNVSNKYYWALVLRTDGNTPVEQEIDGETHKYHYIDISTETCDGTVEVEKGDEICMLGYRGTDDEARQSAIYISAYQSVDQGLTAPLFAEYKGINDFDLAAHRMSYIDATGAHFRGSFSVTDGRTIENYVDETIEEKTSEFKVDIDGLTSKVSKLSRPNILPSNDWKDQDGENLLQENDEEYNLSAKSESTDVSAYPPVMYLNKGTYTMSVYNRCQYETICYGEAKDNLDQTLNIKTMINSGDTWHEQVRAITSFMAPIDGYYKFGITPMPDSYTGDTPYVDYDETSSQTQTKTSYVITYDTYGPGYKTYGTAGTTPFSYQGKITYKSSDEDVATVDTNTGQITPIADGEVTITATSNPWVGNGKIFLQSEASDKFRVISDVYPTIRIKNPTSKIKIGDKYQLEIETSNTAGNGVEYSSTDDTILSVDQFGLVEAISEGSATIRALIPETTLRNIKYYAEYDEFDLAAQEYGYYTTSLSVGADIQPNYKSGTTLDLNVQVYPSSYPGTLTYASNNTDVATVDSNGVVTFKQNGNVLISVNAPFVQQEYGEWSQASLTQYLFCSESIYDGDIASETDDRVQTATDFELPYEICGSGYTMTGVTTILPTSYDGDVVYLTTNSNIATVDSNGVVQAVKDGNASITAMAMGQYKNGKYYQPSKKSVDLTVQSVVDSTITITNKPTTLVTGSTYQLHWAMSPNDRTDTPIFTSSDDTIASVDTNGLITVNSTGNCTIMASLPEIDTERNMKYGSASTSFALEANDGPVTIYYTSTDGKIVEPYSGLSLISNTYEDGQGIMTIESLAELPPYAFTSGYTLETISLPTKITSLGQCSFSDCLSLTDITLPNSLTSIGKYAFADCHSLTGITIPNSMTSINECAFFECDGIRTIIIPNSVTSIGSHAFGGCDSLTGITIPNSVTSIGGYAFMDSGLISITIPNSVTSIGICAFNECYSLSSATIPDSITYIGESVFNSCRSLTGITIPNSVTSIGKSAFGHTASLTDIYYNGTKSEWYNVNRSSTWKSNTYNSTKYVIHCTDEDINVACQEINYTSTLGMTITPGSGLTLYSNTYKYNMGTMEVVYVTTLPSSAFSKNIRLSYIEIPDGVTIIGESAFNTCTSLAEIKISNSVTSIEYMSLANCSKLKKISYNGTKDQWYSITKETNWDYNTPTYTIRCSDGDIAKES